MSERTMSDADVAGWITKALARLDVVQRQLGGELPIDRMDEIPLGAKHALMHACDVRTALLIAREGLGQDPECAERTVYLVTQRGCDDGCPVTVSVHASRAEAEEQAARLGNDFTGRPHQIGEARL